MDRYKRYLGGKMDRIWWQIGGGTFTGWVEEAESTRQTKGAAEKNKGGKDKQEQILV